MKLAKENLKTKEVLTIILAIVLAPGLVRGMFYVGVETGRAIAGLF